MKRFLPTVVLAMLSLVAALANDGVYFANGSQLVPLQETDISVAKEVLTITLTDSGTALVDVQYEFVNRSAPKTVKMGFEAQNPYNSGDTINKAGIHPYINNFVVEFNGEPLRITNYVSGPENPEADVEFQRYAYVYAFDAPFKKGVNRVHHTYSYLTSYSVGQAFVVPYWLLPALRWANGQIDDFTLRIATPGTAKHFCVVDSVFEGADFRVVKGVGKVRRSQHSYSDLLVEVSLRDGVVEWHKTNFRPKADFTIGSLDAYTSFDEKMPVGSFYDRSPRFFIYPIENRKVPADVVRNLPFASRGYVFKRQDLKKYFSRLWWYMPDPSYVPSLDDLNPCERELISKYR